MPKALLGVLLACVIYSGSIPIAQQNAPPKMTAPARMPRLNCLALVSSIKDGETGVRPDRPLVFTIDSSFPGWRGLGAAAYNAPLILEVECNGEKRTVHRSEITLARQPFSLEYLPAPGWKPRTSYSVRLKVVSLPVSVVRFVTGPALHEPEFMQVSSPAEGPVGEKHPIAVKILDHYGLPGWGIAVDVYAIERGPRIEGSLELDTPRILFEESSEGLARVLVSNTEAEQVELTFSPRNGGIAAQSSNFRFVPGPASSVTASAAPSMARSGEPVAVKGRVEDRFGNGCAGAAVNITCRSVISTSSAEPTCIQAGEAGDYEAAIRGTPGEENEIVARSGDASSGPQPVIWYSSNDETTRSYSLLVRDRPLPGPVRAVAPRSVSGIPGSATPGNRVLVGMRGAEIASGWAGNDGSFDLTTSMDMQPGSIITINELPAPKPVTYELSGRFGWGSSDPNKIEFNLERRTTVTVSYHTTETVNPDYHERNLYFEVTLTGYGGVNVYQGGGDYRIDLPAGRYTVAAKSALGTSRAVLKVTIP